MNRTSASRALIMSMILIGTANAGTLFTTPQVFDTGLKATTGQITDLTFAKFDSTLGMLTGVYIRLESFLEAGYSFTDLSGDTNIFEFSASVTAKLANPSDPANPLAVTVPNVNDVSRSVAAFGTYATPGFSSSPILRALTDTSDTGVIVYTAAAILALFEGPGTIDLPTSGSIAWNFSADGDAQTAVSSRYIGTATVYYAYTPSSDVPEPGATGLLLSGFGGIVIAIRRRRAARAVC